MSCQSINCPHMASKGKRRGWTTMELISNPLQRRVSFSKRRQGMFRRPATAFAREAATWPSSSSPSPRNAIFHPSSNGCASITLLTYVARVGFRNSNQRRFSLLAFLPFAVEIEAIDIVAIEESFTPSVSFFSPCTDPYRKLGSHQVTPLKPPAPSNGQIRFRSLSAAELVPSTAADAGHDARIKRTRQDSLRDRIHCFRGVILIVSVFLLLCLSVFFLMPHTPSPIVFSGRKEVPGSGRGKGHIGSRSYAVIFDAGSSGSRVHVYCFDEKLELLHVGNGIELFEQQKPGLSFYAKDPQEAANSLLPLLEKAESVIPLELRRTAPVRLGATAGLRVLGAETSEHILQEVRDLLQQRSSLKFQSDWVTVLDGAKEGAFQWVTINYLLGKLGKPYQDTVGVVDLGGGSVQMAYAISEIDAATAPEVSNGEDSYVRHLFLKGKNYHLYVHSYLHYGLLAARAEILKAADDYSNCILGGYNGSYSYGDAEYEAAASTSGASFSKCRSDAIKALKVDESTCTHMKCTFGGVWNGGGGDGQRNLFVASFFYDRAVEVGFVDDGVPAAGVKPEDFKDAATHACALNINDAKTKYPRVHKDSLPYLCMDLVYQFTLLVDGFALDRHQEITLVKKVKYNNEFVEAAWPLGSAIEVASTP